MNYIVKLMTVRCYSTNVYNGKLTHNDKEMNIWELLLKKIQK